MKKYQIGLMIVAFTGLLGLSLWVALKETENIVYADANRLFNEYKGTASLKKEFETKRKSMQANVDSLMQEWQNELKVYEKERTSMSENELKLKEEILSNKQNNISNYQQAIQKQIAEEDQKMTQSVFNEINAVVKEYGKKKGYDLILGANGSGNILYADEDAVDITDEILEELNQ